MQVFDEREYEPAIQLFRACSSKQKAVTHLKIAKWGFVVFIGFIVIVMAWTAGKLS